MKLENVAQLYLSGAIYKVGRKLDVTPLLPLLKARPEEFVYETTQPNIAIAVVIHGTAAQVELVDQWVREDMDNPEVEEVVLMLYSRYLLLGEEPVCMDDYRDYIKRLRKNLLKPSPMMAMLSDIAREREMSVDEVQSAMMRNLRSDERGIPVVAEKKPGRNELCPCGSGRKYKKCCGK